LKAIQVVYQNSREPIFQITRGLIHLHHLTESAEVSALKPMIPVPALGRQADSFPS